MTTEIHDFLCETCGITAKLTDDEAYDAGWDYPPFIGMWGVISPRTCPDCPMETTAWWAILQSDKQDINLSQHHQETAVRIMAEIPYKL